MSAVQVCFPNGYMLVVRVYNVPPFSLFVSHGSYNYISPLTLHGQLDCSSCYFSLVTVVQSQRVQRSVAGRHASQNTQKATG